MYHPINTDFGPLDLSCIYKYCQNVNQLLNNPELSRFSICHYTSLVPARRANSAFLICCYQILCLNTSPEEAWQPFSSISRFLPFRDSGSELAKFELYIIDCLNALYKAKTLQWFDLDTFDCNEYLKFTDFSNGGANWIVPMKLLAFPSPFEQKRDQRLAPEDYEETFQTLGIKCVIRLNDPNYESLRFRKLGFRHYDIKYGEKSIPSPNTIKQFIDICRRESAIAVHCQNGLDKTPTLIGCYVIKHYNFTGREFIAWARMSRPGSVQGQQQNFLCEYYNGLFKEFNITRMSLNLQEEKITKSPSYKISPTLRSRASVYSSVSVNDCMDLPKYKTRYNQLVGIDPDLLRLYKKK